MSFSFVRGMVMVLALVVFGSVPLLAQNGRIQGVITDPAGATIAGAQVRLTDTAKGVVVKEMVTTQDGNFALQPLQAGDYSLTAESPGMKKLERTGIVLDVNQILSLGDLSMSLGSSSQQITVAATTPLVETTTGQKAFTITSKQVLETSLNGRDFQSLLRTQPGVVSNDSSDFRLAFNNTDSFHVNGLRGSQNNVYLDGSINTDVGANDGQYTQLSLDAIGEFRVQTSVFNAEYGRIAGILIAANTKSGGQQYHGTAYEFNRNDAYDANSFFNNLQGAPKSKLRYNQFGGNLGGPIEFLPKISTHNNKKLFFFFNYEGTRAGRPVGNSYYDVPNPALLNGDFSKSLRFNDDGTPQYIKNPGTNQLTPFQVGTVFQPGTLVRDNAGNILSGVPFPGNRVPQSLFSSQYAAFAKTLTPAYRGMTSFTQTPGTPDSVRIPYQDNYSFNKDQKAVRVDYAISPNANAFFRWVDDAQSESQNFGIFSGNSFPVLPQFRAKPGASWAWNVINTISPTTTNEFIFTYNHLTQIVDIANSVNKATYDQTQLGYTYQQLYPQTNLRNIFPEFSAGGFSVSPFPPGWASEGRTFAWTDNFSKVVGSHIAKAGVFVNMNLNGQQPFFTESPRFDFNPNQLNAADTGNGVANLLLGNYSSVSQTNGVFFGDFKFYQTEAYVQDSWKVKPNFTLEYGVRWVYAGPTFTQGKYLQNYFDPALYNPAQAVTINTNPGVQYGSIVPNSGNPFNGIIQEGSKGLPSGFSKHRFNNWSPRLGFAWDPKGDGKTAIRGGGGVFYERVRQNVTSFDGLGNPPLVYTPNLFNNNIDTLSPNLVANGPRFPVSLNAFGRDGKLPSIYSWSFDIQHQFTNSLALDVGYVGNAATHLEYARNANSLPLGTTTGSNILETVNQARDAIRPYKGYTGIDLTQNGSNSNYHALQVLLTRRFTTNVTISAAYTWSRAMDQIDDDTTQIPYAYDRRREYAPAGFDREHTFSLNYVWTLPTLSRYNQLVKQTLGGWEFSGITRFWSGFPLSVLSPNTNPGTLDGGARADYLGGQVKPDNPTWQQYFDPFVFARPVDGTLGNTGRNFFRGPGINQWDISLFKNFNFTEKMRLQIRLETFNTFNHTQFAGVNTSIYPANPGDIVTAGANGTVGTSGQVNSTREPRNVQLGAKFYF